jgi:hypothetical protein
MSDVGKQHRSSRKHHEGGNYSVPRPGKPKQEPSHRGKWSTPRKLGCEARVVGTHRTSLLCSAELRHLHILVEDVAFVGGPLFNRVHPTLPRRRGSHSFSQTVRDSVSVRCMDGNVG